MALTKVSGPLLHGSNDNLGNYNINNITGAAATFSRVSVGGTLTYDDVTNVDSVGIVTARGGLHVGAGGTIIHALSEDNGKVGIGTDLSTTPSSVLTVAPYNSTSGRNISLYTSGAVGNKAGLFFNATSGTGNLAEIQAEYKGTNEGELVLSTSLQKRIILQKGGNVGIGSENPGKHLDVYRNGLVNARIKGNVASGLGAELILQNANAAANGYSEIQFQDSGTNVFSKIRGFNLTDGSNNGYMALYTASATEGLKERVRISDAGKVGIGTDVPDYGLHVFGAGDILVEDGNNGSAHLRLRSSVNGSDVSNWKIKTGSNNYLFIDNDTVGGTSQLTIDDSNRVGINSTSPTGDLDVVGSVGTAATIFINAPVHNTNVASISMLKLGFKHSGGQAVGYLKLIEGGGNAFDGSLRFGVPYNLGGGNFGTRDDVVTISHNGTVGIGSTIPTNTLVVREQTDNNPSIQLFRPSTGGDIANIIWRTNSGNQAQINYRGGSGSEGLQFYTGGTGSSNLRAIIDTDGKIGIGTHDPQAPVHIDGGTTGTQRLRVQNHQSVGAFSGNYGSEFRHATSSANHCMLIHCQEANDDRRTLDISDSNGVFAQFVNGKFGVGTAGNDAGHPTRDVEICSPDGGILRISSSDDSLAGNERIGAIEFHTDDDDGGHVSCAITAIADPSDNFGRRGALIFGTQNSDSPPGDAIERVRINASGLVGVGNTAPEGKGIDIQHSRTNAYSRTGDNRGLAHLIVRNSSDAADRFSSISWVSGGGTQAEGSINLIQTGSYTGDFAIKLRDGSGSSDWRERLRITSGGVVHQSGATDESTWSRQTGRAQQGDGVAVTYSIKTFYYGTATFRIGLSDGNYKWATLVVEIGGHQYSSGNGYNATVVSNSTGNGPSISLNKQDGGYHITITNGGNSNTLFGSWVLEGTSYSNLSKPTLVLS